MNLLCELLIGRNATFVSEDSTDPSAQVQLGLGLGLLLLSIAFFSAVLIFVSINRFIKRSIDKESRKVAILSCYGSIVGSFIVSMLSVMYIYGFEAVAQTFSPLIIPALFAIEVYTQSRLRIPLYTLSTSFLTLLAGIIFSLLVLHFYPQRAFAQCDSSSLFTIGMLVFLFAGYLVIFISRNSSLWKTLTADKLYIWDNQRAVGYLAKKEGVWVKFELNDVPMCDEKLLVQP